MKVSEQKQFEEINVFGTGKPNDAFARYFVGKSFLNPLTNPQETAVFLANVTFEPGCRKTGIYITPKAAAVRFSFARRARAGIRRKTNRPFPSPQERLSRFRQR